MGTTVVLRLMLSRDRQLRKMLIHLTNLKIQHGKNFGINFEHKKFTYSEIQVSNIVLEAHSKMSNQIDIQIS